MQIRRKTPERWKLKDISGLHYSCLALIKTGLLTERDLYRFISTYRGIPLRQIFPGDESFWSGLKSRAENLHDDEQRKSLRGSPATAKTMSTARAQH